MRVLAVVAILTTCLVCCKAANILVFATFPGYSHWIIIQPILIGLANKGHNVTVVGYFPQKTPIKNYHDIDVSHTMPLVTNNISIAYSEDNMRSYVGLMTFLVTVTERACRYVLEEEFVKNLVNSTDANYDVVMTESFGNDCFAAFAYKLKLPLVSIVTSLSLPWTEQRISNPENPSYIPMYFTEYSHRMTLYERFVNTFMLLYGKVFYRIKSDWPGHEIAKKYFGESLPPLYEITQNTSLILLNTHYSYREVHPRFPNIIEIAGVHLVDPKPLPLDLQGVLDSAKQGVVIFSLGSMLKSSTFPEKILQSFIKAFSKIPYLVLWKVENHIPNLPPNVVTRKWLPTNDILHHPNIKVMITHGGMATTVEVVNSGVPIVGMPMYADQPGNINGLVEKGAGVTLDYFKITEEYVYNAIMTVATNPSYKKNAKKLSELFKDREQSPLDKAIYWIEYVIRHKGAPHLRSASNNLYWFQYLLLDIVFIVAVIVLSMVYLIYTFVRIVKQTCFVSNKTKTE